MTQHADDSATQHEAMVRQNLLGRLIFASRWLQLPIYLGLIGVQAIYSYKFFSAHDKKIKKSDKTRHNSNFFDELNHAKSYQT